MQQFLDDLWGGPLAMLHHPWLADRRGIKSELPQPNKCHLQQLRVISDNHYLKWRAKHSWFGLTTRRGNRLGSFNSLNFMRERGRTRSTVGSRGVCCPSAVRSDSRTKARGEASAWILYARTATLNTRTVTLRWGGAQAQVTTATLHICNGGFSKWCLPSSETFFMALAGPVS
jgi:hypothetical protein